MIKILILWAALGFADKLDFPKYEEEFNATLAEMNGPDANPREVQKKFYALVTAKNKAVSAYINQVKKYMAEERDKERRRFEEEMKKETEQWEKDNPKGDKKARRDQVNAARKQKSEAAFAEKKSLEELLRGQKMAYDQFVTAKKRDFNQRFGEKMKAGKEQAAKAAKSPSEFQEIPKDKGIILAPGEQ